MSSFNDRPIRLPKHPDPYQEPQCTIPIWITQSNVDGMQALIQWIDGFQRAGHQGNVPGGHELIMFYRTIASAVYKHNEELRLAEAEKNEKG